MQKRHVLFCEDSLCPRKQPDISGPGLREAGRYSGLRGTVVSGKLPKVKENPAAASIWMLTLAEKKTSDCLSNKSTRGMPGGRFVGEEGIPEPRTRWLRVDARV